MISNTLPPTWPSSDVSPARISRHLNRYNTVKFSLVLTTCSLVSPTRPGGWSSYPANNLKVLYVPLGSIPLARDTRSESPFAKSASVDGPTNLGYGTNGRIIEDFRIFSPANVDKGWHKRAWTSSDRDFVKFRWIHVLKERRGRLYVFFFFVRSFVPFRFVRTPRVIGRIMRALVPNSRRIISQPEGSFAIIAKRDFSSATESRFVFK